MTRLYSITRIAMLAAAVLGCAAAIAQTYPVKPIRVIVPFGAGGPADIYARYLGQHMQGVLGQPFVVEDRPGAGSIIGTDIVAKSAPDGYTLLIMSNTHTVNESLIPKKPFVLMKDFVPVVPINSSDLLLVVHPSLPVKSVKELVALAKSKPRGLNYASSGNGTPYHMAGELFKALAGVDIVHVPHKGSGEARTSIDERTDRADARCDHHDGADRQGRESEGAWHLRPQAFRGNARSADDFGSGRQRLRNHHLDRHHGACRHAAGRDRASQRRGHESHRQARRQETVGRAGCAAHDDDGCGIREASYCRYRQVGEGGKDLRSKSRSVNR